MKLPCQLAKDPATSIILTPVPQLLKPKLYHVDYSFPPHQISLFFCFTQTVSSNHQEITVKVLLIP